MAAAMIVPGIITAIFAFLNNNLKPMVDAFVKRFYEKDSSKTVTRKIEFEQSAGYGRTTASERDQRNNILQKALTMYIGEHCGSFEYKNANIALMAAKEKGQRNENWDMEYGSTHEQLKAYAPMTVPPVDEWVDVEKEKGKEVKFKEAVYREDEEDGEKKKIEKKNRVFMFQAENPDGGKKIDDFISKAFSWYTQTMEEKCKDNSRYM